MTVAKMLLLTALIGCGCLLAGCPGMPGAPGGGEQKMPPGVLPPPGLESGGARTLMGTTVTPPDNAFLLVSFATSLGEAAAWRSCRRVIPLESCLIVEGLNYDGRAKDEPQDVNQLIPYAALKSFQWKYEAKPTPPAAPAAQPGAQPKPQAPAGK